MILKNNYNLTQLVMTYCTNISNSSMQFVTACYNDVSFKEVLTHVGMVIDGYDGGGGASEMGEGGVPCIAGGMGENNMAAD